MVFVAVSAFAQSDPQATRETRALYSNLRKVGQKHLIYGHHNTVVQGQTWKHEYESIDRSDVKTATGTFPALYGFDFNRGIHKHEKQVKAIFKRGGIITYSWHARNPLNMGAPEDATGNPLQNLMPGGKGNQVWSGWLDEMADYFQSLEVDGVKVPIIFRPFHENTGDWFWWGAKHCTPEEYKAAWRYTVDYLRGKGVHNLLMAYSPSKPSRYGYEERYPGDDYVDIIGFDHYYRSDQLDSFMADCRMVVDFSEARGKVPAATEIGPKDSLVAVTRSDWFTGEFLAALKEDPVACRLAYMMTWMNSDRKNSVPLPGQRNHEDYLKFHRDPFILFSDRLPPMYR